MNRKLILLLPIIAGIFWGGGGVFVRILASYGMDSVSIFATRVVLGCLIFFIGILLFNRDLFKIKLKDLWIFFGSGIIGVLFLNLCYNEAAFRLTLSLSSVLLSLAPIFALFISAIIFKERITFKKILCLVMAIFGCMLVTGVFESTNVWSLTGIIFGLLSALFWALYGIFSKFATEKGYSTYTTIFYSFLFISIVLIPLTDWNSFANFLVSNPVYTVPFALIHSLTTSVCPYLLFTIALRTIDAGKATILCGGAEPMSATVFGLLIFSETPTVLNLIGIVITIIALSILVAANESED